jgi:hypothetical protein
MQAVDTAQLGENSPTAGTGCTSSDGSHLALTLTTSFPEDAGLIVIDSITLSLPAQSGVSHFTVSNGGSAAADSYSVTGRVCATKIPIPEAIPGNAAERPGPVGGDLR